MIAMVPLSVRVDAEGVRESTQAVVDEIQLRLGEDLEWQVVAGGARGSTKNALIARAQANQRRNPFYLNKGALQAIKFLVNGVTSQVSAVREAAVKQIGDVMIQSIGENVNRRENPDGSGFKGLTGGYAKRKLRKFGFIHPILRATGDLLNGLRVRIVRGRT